MARQRGGGIPVRRAYNTRTQGITIRPSADFYKASLLHFTDASYQSDPITRRSISGHFTMVDETLLDWTSKHQPYVTLSTGEAEIVAATATATHSEYWVNRGFSSQSTLGRNSRQDW